jgi:outer membrane protein
MMRMSLLKRALLAGSAMFVLSMGGASAQTIVDALTSAYRTNPPLLSTRASLRALDEGVPKALSGWRPTVTLSGSIGKSEDHNRTTNTVTQATTRTERIRTPDQASLTLSQPIYRGGRTLSDVSKAENLVQRGRAVLQGIEQTVLLEAATAYADLVQAQAVLDLSINNEQVLTKQLEATRDRFSVGEVTRTDVSQAEARLEQARADRIGAEGVLISARASYEKTVGVSAPGRAATARLPQNLPLSDADVRTGAANHPDLIAARFFEKAAADDVDLIAGEKLPTVNLNGSLARNTENQTRGVQQDTASVSVSVSVPLYQAGQTDARVREAKQTAAQRRIDVETQRRSTLETALRRLEALHTARARITSFEAQIRSSEIALEGVEQEARVGLRTVLDVLNAEQELFTARVNLARQQREEVVAAYQLASSVGRLTATELGLPVEVYDPTRYYNETRGRFIGMGIQSEDRSTPLSPAAR